MKKENTMIEKYTSLKNQATYHDTYVVGVDNQGRMTVVSITNKADSALKDPHNNTTPANRLCCVRRKI